MPAGHPGRWQGPPLHPKLPSLSLPSVRLNRGPAPTGESFAELSVRAQLLLSLMLLGHYSRKPLIRTLFFFFLYACMSRRFTVFCEVCHFESLASNPLTLCTQATMFSIS